jgi:hypothetical protein
VVTAAFASGLPIGTEVDVRDRFRARWSRGYEIAAKTSSGYLVRRRSDRSVLPVEFAPRDVSLAR